jgi:hypothetical protein
VVSSGFGCGQVDNREGCATYVWLRRQIKCIISCAEGFNNLMRLVVVLRCILSYLSFNLPLLRLLKHLLCEEEGVDQV